MVSAASKGLRVRLEPAPAAMATIIVSPMAREIPTITAAAKPDVAAGTTMRREVSSLVAPKPKEASRKERGTA